MKKQSLLISFPGGAELLLIAVALLVIFTVIHAAQRTFKNKSSKAIWIILLVLPFTGGVATIVYWLLKLTSDNNPLNS